MRRAKPSLQLPLPDSPGRSPRKKRGIPRVRSVEVVDAPVRVEQPTEGKDRGPQCYMRGIRDRVSNVGGWPGEYGYEARSEGEGDAPPRRLPAGGGRGRARLV